MDFEERERQRRRQFIKVLIAEIGMVLAVIAIVVVTTLAAMGFFVSEDGKLEQSGLIQIHSIPTGATVEIDGNALFARTNLSRTLAPNKYDLKITREHYDTWSKQVQIYSGMLIRLYYPRLFLEHRIPETVRALNKDVMFYAPSGDRTNVLYAYRGETEWHLLDIRGDEVREKKLDLSKILLKSGQTRFDGQVEILEWSKDNDNVLVKVKQGSSVEWILVNLHDVGRSLNLTTAFGMEFEQVEMMGGSARQLFAREKQHLRRINATEQAISKVLLDHVTNFVSCGTNLMYVMSTRSETGLEEQLVGTYRDGEAGGTTIARLSKDAAVQIDLIEYYDEEYLAYTADQKLAVYYGAVPAFRAETDLTELSGLKVLLKEQVLQTVPEHLTHSAEGEFLVAQRGEQLMAVDFETGELYEYAAPTTKVRWLDESILYATIAGELRIWDFDFTNQRVLVQPETLALEQEVAAVTTVSETAVADYAAVISQNNKWLYYLAKAENGHLELMREKIRD